MRRVQEVIHIVPAQQEAFLEQCLHPTLETQQAYWVHNVRNQYYFRLNDVFLMTFEYVGNDFKNDMDGLTRYLDSHKYLVRKRRRDVPMDQLANENWWAPLRRLGEPMCVENPMPVDESDYETFRDQLDSMCVSPEFAGRKYDLSFDAYEWSVFDSFVE